MRRGGNVARRAPPALPSAPHDAHGALLPLPLAQVEAANVITTVASAAEGYPFVPPAWAPSLFVPLTGLLLPAVGMAWAFTYISK